MVTSLTHEVKHLPKLNLLGQVVIWSPLLHRTHVSPNTTPYELRWGDWEMGYQSHMQQSDGYSLWLPIHLQITIVTTTASPNTLYQSFQLNFQELFRLCIPYLYCIQKADHQYLNRKLLELILALKCQLNVNCWTELIKSFVCVSNFKMLAYSELLQRASSQQTAWVCVGYLGISLFMLSVQ